MTQRLIEFARSRRGVVSVAGLAALLGIVYFGRALLFPPTLAGTQSLTCLDTTTGKTFTVTLQMGMTFPVRAPSGGNTGYPAEACYWDADGNPRETPVYVVLGGYLGKEGPTYCPDCGRLVVAQNPRPVAGVAPPGKKPAARAAR